uniref:Uncharacterized protein n=1 Tax=Arundo donax TaxID=35708 RepID=A0A0A8ZSQ5_ARUDO
MIHANHLMHRQEQLVHGGHVVADTTSKTTMQLNS